MWEFKRGKPEALEGIASLYLHNRMLHTHQELANHIQPEYLAVRVGSSFLDLVLPGDDESINEFHKKLSEETPGPLKGSLENKLMIGRAFELNDLNLLEEIPRDIIFVGNIVCLAHSENILKAAMAMYSNDYKYQLSQGISGRGKRVVVPKEDFRLLDEIGLTARLGTLTSELYRSRELGDVQKERYARAQLMQLAEGAPFDTQIRRIVEAFARDLPDSIKQIELNITLAGLIHGAKYEEAIKLRDEILKLSR